MVPRTPRFVRLAMVRRIVVLVCEAPDLASLCMLLLASYAFLLRLPSEALPLAVGAAPVGKEAPVFRVHKEKVELWLPRRKNRLYPTSLFRSCWCRQCPITCPVHVLGKWLAEFPRGTQPFVAIGANGDMRGLRSCLATLGVPDAEAFRTQDLRRGHAEDMRLAGSTLGEILRAGDWRTPAFLRYLDAVQVEHDRTVEAHLGDSSDEEVWFCVVCLLLGLSCLFQA